MSLIANLSEPTKERNVSFVLYKVHDTKFEEREVPTYGDDDVLIAVKKTGICGSDVHYLNHGRIGHFIVEKPMCLGHESSGIVVKTGKNVKALTVGQRVALEPQRVCRQCYACKSGHYEICPNVVFAATPPFEGGTLAGYFALPGDFAYPLSENMTLEDGCMIEPLAVAVHSTVTIGRVRASQNVAVFGAGPVGLLCMAVAKAMGARRVIAIDINEERLKFAKSYVATDVLLPPKPREGETKIDHSKRIAEELRKNLGLEDRGLNAVDLVVEASGAEACIQIGLFLVKAGGTFVQVGMGTPEVQIPVTELLAKQVEFKGSFRYGPDAYPLAISLVSQSRIDLKPLVTHRYPFKQASEAFEATRVGKGSDGKSVIKCIIDGPEGVTD